MQQFEQDYAKLIEEVLESGEVRQTRNGETRSRFGMNLTIPMNGDLTFPIIQGRKMWHRGVLGELAAMLRKPTCLADFEKYGCNYWKKWAKPDGSINIDYGNAWHEDGQIDHLRECLKNNPTDRRMIINGWRPEMLGSLDLPCCHLLYQFYVRDGKYLDIMWYQRSVDMMIGLPSDIIFAAAWLIAISREFGYMPGEIKMTLGDCHVYKEHYAAALVYTNRVKSCDQFAAPSYHYAKSEGSDFCEFEPQDLHISGFNYLTKLNLELKA